MAECAADHGWDMAALRTDADLRKAVYTLLRAKLDAKRRTEEGG
jgi:hypothetical protein